MAQATAGLTRNLKRYELALVVLVLGVLIYMFTQRVRQAEAEWERTSVELMQRQIQNSLTIMKMTAMTQGRYVDIARWAGANPFELMQFKPGNYAGETAKDDPAQIPAGNWYYDRGDGALIYKVSQGGYLRTDLPGVPRIRFRLDVVYQDVNGNQRYDSGIDRFEGLSLHALDKYEWLENGRN